MTDFEITEHAFFEMKRRGLTEEMVHLVLSSPEQRMEIRPGRLVLQSRIPMGEPAKTYLLRVFLDVDRSPVQVVTAYRTSKISKYWRDSREGELRS